MAIVFSKEMVKCLWSNSQSSSTDCLCSEGPKYADCMLEKYILLLFMFKTVVLLNIFVETLMQKVITVIFMQLCLLKVLISWKNITYFSYFLSVCVCINRCILTSYYYIFSLFYHFNDIFSGIHSCHGCLSFVVQGSLRSLVNCTRKLWLWHVLQEMKRLLSSFRKGWKSWPAGETSERRANLRNRSLRNDPNDACARTHTPGSIIHLSRAQH